MNLLNCPKLFKQLATFAGIAGVSSLIAVPGIAELNRSPQSFNQAGDRVFELAQTSPNTPDSSDTPSSPSNNQNPGVSSDTPSSPSNNQNPGDSSDTPSSPSNNQNPGDSSDTPSSPSNNQNPGDSSDTPSSPSNNQNPGGASDSPSSPSNNQNFDGSPNTQRGETSPNSLSSRDRNFVLQAARSNMLEVELGRLAVQRGASAVVKQHGQQMVEEHTQVNQQLMQLAMQKGIEVPREMNSQNKASIDRLSALSGTSFDAAYKQAMLESHSQAIALFQAQSQQGQDPELKAWATQLLPNLQAHLQMINQMAGNTTQR